MKKNFYAIRIGRECNLLVKTWAECSELTSGYPGAVFKGFSAHQEAIAFLDGKPPKWAAPKSPDRAAKECGPEDSVQSGVFIPATVKKDKYGYFKPRYYRYRGCLGADYGRIIGKNYVPGHETGVPWD